MHGGHISHRFPLHGSTKDIIFDDIQLSQLARHMQMVCNMRLTCQGGLKVYLCDPWRLFRRLCLCHSCHPSLCLCHPYAPLRSVYASLHGLLHRQIRTSVQLCLLQQLLWLQTPSLHVPNSVSPAVAELYLKPGAGFAALMCRPSAYMPQSHSTGACWLVHASTVRCTAMIFWQKPTQL